MKDEIIVPAIIIIIICILGIWIDVYKYKDCKKVGHSKMYCILSFGG